MGKLSEADRVNLGWMVRCNDEYRVGYLGPTVRRFGPLPECASLVEGGFARCVTHFCGRRETPKARGYWITVAGRTALAAQKDNPNG